MLKNANRSISISLHKTQVQVDQDLNINLGTLNLIEEKVGNSLKCISTGDNFLNGTPVVQAIRSTINNGTS